jgi:preflagellin peptidase FlaK
MNEIELIRVLVAFTMLGAASYYDVRSREINDLLWVVFGAAGAFLYVFDAFSFSITTAIWAGLTLFVAFLCWMLRLCGDADVLALVTLSVILPSHEQVPATIVVLVIASAIAFSYALTNNVYKNLKSLITNRELFADMDEPFYKKLVAFFIIHARNRKFEFSAETMIDGKRKFVFRHEPNSETFGNSNYVTTALPLMPFLLISLVFFIMISLF